MNTMWNIHMRENYWAVLRNKIINITCRNLENMLCEQVWSAFISFYLVILFCYRHTEVLSIFYQHLLLIHGKVPGTHSDMSSTEVCVLQWPSPSLCRQSASPQCRAWKGRALGACTDVHKGGLGSSCISFGLRLHKKERFSEQFSFSTWNTFEKDG